MIAQFFSKYYNRRTDAYGGSLENAAASSTRSSRHPSQAGAVSHLGPHLRRRDDDEPGFLTMEDGLEIGRHLEAQGIDCINISNGSSWNGNANCEPFSYSPAGRSTWPRPSRSAVHSRHRHQHHQGPGFRRIFVEEGVSDFVALGRSQFADPEFMNKARGRQAGEHP